MGDILCVEIETKTDLAVKAMIKNESHVDFLWSIIENQRRPKSHSLSEQKKKIRKATLSPKSVIIKELEGYEPRTPPPPIPKVPKGDEYDAENDDIVTTKQPGHRSVVSKDVDDIEVNS